MKIKILAISGSIRKDSSNHKVINNLTSILPDNVELIVYNELGQLPHFDDEEKYPIVNEWRKQLQEADGVLICSPEYAYGVPGTLKNALDWTVSSGEFYNKPVALITASGYGEKAHAAMTQILTALSAKMNDDTKKLVPFIRSKFNENGELNSETLVALEGVLKNLIQLIETNQPIDS